MKPFHIALGASLMLAIALPNPLLACGKERWPVKVVTDAQRNRIDSTPHPATIDELRKIHAPINPSARNSSRYAPVEFTVYEITGTMTLIKREADEDYHIVVTDEQGQTMIVESSAPKCAKNSRFVAQITQVRAKIDKAVGPVDQPQNPKRVVTVTGVGFFDRIHGQDGVAPNGIELHPVLAIDFHDAASVDELKQKLHKQGKEPVE